MFSESVLPYDIIVLIVDIVGENKETDLLKELALVSHSFLQICSKHLFATVILHDALSNVASSKKGFIKLIKSRPDVVKHIRTLVYHTDCNKYCTSSDNNDNLLSPILPNFLRTIPRLNCLKIAASMSEWNILNSSLTSAFLHLMHLPTINHIGLAFITHFPLSILTSSVNLLRLDVSHLKYMEDTFECVPSEMMPKIREFHSFESFPVMLQAEVQDGRPAFSFMDLKRLSISLTQSEDEQNIRYILQNAKLLEKLHISVGDLVELRDTLRLSSSARTLKVLDLSVSLYSYRSDLLLSGLCEELEAMAGHNMLEVLSFEVKVYYNMTVHLVESSIQEVGKVLVNPGWPALRQVSIKISCDDMLDSAKLEALRSLPDKYLSNLSKLESVDFNYSIGGFGKGALASGVFRDYHPLYIFLLTGNARLSVT